MHIVIQNTIYFIITIYVTPAYALCLLSSYSPMVNRQTVLVLVGHSLSSSSAFISNMLKIIISCIPVVAFHFLIHHQYKRALPILPEDGFYGEGNSFKDDISINQFTIDVEDHKLKQLKELLKIDQPLQQMGKLMQLLQENFENFDWKQHQYFFNTFKHYKTEIEGLQIHFVRQIIQPKKNEVVIPLILIHGFPGSWWHFYKAAPLLSNPSRYGFDFGVKQNIKFDVIIPSLPGFIWSEKPSKGGMWIGSIARIFSKLLSRLELDNIFIHGTGFLGAEVAAAMAAMSPKQVKGLHLTNPQLIPFCDFQTSLLHFANSLGYSNDADNKNTDPIDLVRFNFADNGGEAWALQNSPLGLAAYLMDTWATYSSNKELNELFTIDELLTEIHLYWLTNTIPNALYILRESAQHRNRCALTLAPVEAPTSIAQTPDCPFRTSRLVLQQKFHNITRYVILPKGGVFVSLQDAHEFAADIFAFVELQLLE